MIAEIICSTIAGAISAAIVVKKMCIDLIEKIDKTETEHRKELLEVAKATISRVFQEGERNESRRCNNKVS